MTWIIILLVLVIIVAMIAHNSWWVLNVQSIKPTIWKEYTRYLVSGQRQRIPFDSALSAWREDHKRFARRNVKIPEIKICPRICPRICTWNVHTWKKADGQDVTVDQIDRELEIINADILCLQEYSHREDISTVLDNKYPYKFAQMIGTMNFGNAIYSMKPITNTQVINLPVHPEVSESRICLVAQTYDIWVLNTHLEVRNAYPHVHKYRYPQIDTILNEVRSIGITGDPVVIVGDLNVGNKSKIDKKFHEHIMDASMCSVDMDTRMRNLVHNSNIYGGFVDHIYYKCDALGAMGAYEYFTDSGDHYPVIADIFRKHFIKSESDIDI